MTTPTQPPQTPFLSNTVVSGEPSTPAIDHGDSLVQISGSLGGIILLILAGAWLVKKLGFTPKKFSKDQIIHVKSSCSLGNKERVVVVEVNNECLVLGVTAQSINLLHQYPAAQQTPVETSVEPLTFQSVFQKKQDAAQQASVVPFNK